LLNMKKRWFIFFCCNFIFIWINESNNGAH
jgi:hypothetical protein